MSDDPFESLFRTGRTSRFSPALDPSWVPQEGEAYPDGMQPSGWIEDGVISDASFAASIDPVLLRTTATLTNPDAVANPNRVAFNTDDSKLYRSDGATWTKAVDGADIIAASIVAGKIAAGAISATELAAGAVTADKISVGGLQQIGDLVNGSFEDVVPGGELFQTVAGLQPGWAIAGNSRLAFPQGTTWERTGTRVAYVGATGPTSFAYAWQRFPVQAGRRYRVSGWYGMQTLQAGVSASIICHTIDKSGSFVNFSVVGTSTHAAASLIFGAGEWTCPTDGSVSYLEVELRIDGNPTTGVGVFDDVHVTLADLTTANGDVVIDSSGITITNGKLTFADQFGATAMNGYGFGPSWMRFIATRFYNGDFAAGLLTDFPVSEVGSGATLADYLASQSAALPSWVVAASTAQIRLIADATASSGKSFESRAFAAGDVGRVYQDIPVSFGQGYRVDVAAAWQAFVGNTLSYRTYLSWRDASHALVGARTLVNNLTFSANSTAYSTLASDTGTLASPRAPSNASYLRFEIEVTHNLTTASVITISEVKGFEVSLFDGNQTVSSLTLTTVDQNAVSATLVPGRYLVTGTINANITTAGVGDVTAGVYLDGGMIGGLPTWTAPAATAKTPMAVTAYVTVPQGAAGALTIRCKKSINAGVATVTGGLSNIVIIGLK